MSEYDDDTTETTHTAPEQGAAPDSLDETDPMPEQGSAPAETAAPSPDEEVEQADAALTPPPAKATRRRARRPAVAAFSAPETPDTTAAPDTSARDTAAGVPAGDPTAEGAEPTEDAPRRRRARRPVAMPTFQAVDPAAVPESAAEPESEPPTKAPPRKRATKRAAAATSDAGTTAEGTTTENAPETGTTDQAEDDRDDEDTGPRRRRRGRRGRGRGRGEGGDSANGDNTDAETDEGNAGDRAGGASAEPPATGPDDEPGDGAGGTRRRRRRRRGGSGEGDDGVSPDDPPNTVVRVRQPRAKKAADPDGVRGVSGSTRLAAKRARRQDGRGSSRRAPIVTESEYLARREAVERTMIVRNQGERTQIAVTEDGVLVEHYVTRASATSYAGNVYLGKVQNVLPSMEAAFVDIGKGRNAVLYAGEVNYETAGIDGGRAHSIQEALKSGQNVLVQVTKDPIGQKGSRLTSQVTLPGRYLVYVPEGSMTGISRKLPDTERARLKAILKKIVPDDAGVIIRTAAEGASEEELSRDVERLQQQWADIQKAAKKAEKHAPAVLHAEPDLVVRVVRDVFNEDFTSLVVQGGDEWETIEAYVAAVAPDLLERASRWTSETDVFTDHRVTEQLVRALDRKVHLPSGGSLVIDRTEAMTVVDVNTGKFTGKGGNLEETVTKNNLEAAEEIVRQLRLRDVGGIIVIDFIDMVLESNRDLVLRRLTECLGRDRTRHQVAEVTSLGLVQMTRKRVGTGLIEAYSEPCLACQGRGVIIHMDGPPAEHAHTRAPTVLARPKPPMPRPPSAVALEAAETSPAGEVRAEAAEMQAEPAQAKPTASEDQPVVEAPAPKRRRRRATSGGPVSAVPEDAGVS